MVCDPDLDPDIPAAFDGLDDTATSSCYNFPLLFDNSTEMCQRNYSFVAKANDSSEHFETVIYETSEKDRMMMKRSLDDFNQKAIKRARFINNSLEYYGKIMNRLHQPHKTIADVYAADPYLANRSLFDDMSFGKANKSTCAIPSKKYDSGENSFSGTPLAMRKVTNDGTVLNDRLFDIVYFQNAEMISIKNKPSPNCYNCTSHRIKCHSSPGKGRCNNCKKTGDDMVCIFEGKWVPFAKSFPEHPWSRDILNCELYF